MNFLSTNIKHLRKLKGVTQAEIATSLNKVPSSIGNWESEISEPNISELMYLANFFDVTLDDLINEDLQVTMPSPESKPKIKKRRPVEYVVNPDNLGEVNDPGVKQDLTNWAVLNELKSLRQDVNKILDIVEKNADK